MHWRERRLNVCLKEVAAPRRGRDSKTRREGSRIEWGQTEKCLKMRFATRNAGAQGRERRIKSMVPSCANFFCGAALIRSLLVSGVGSGQRNGRGCVGKILMYRRPRLPT